MNSKQKVFMYIRGTYRGKIRDGLCSICTEKTCSRLTVELLSASTNYEI